MTARPQSRRRQGPVDDGLQIERTILAWKRSLLSGTVLLITVMKVGVHVCLPWTLALLAGTVLVAGSAAVAVTRSHRRAADRFRDIDAAASSASPDPDAPGAPFGLLGPGWTLMTALVASLCALILLIAFILGPPPLG